MVHQLITIAEDIEFQNSVWSIFDQKLEAALYAVEVAVSIRLRSEMGHGIELIRWLEGWNLRFKQEQKNFICIVEDPVQQQCLELSHPNMELVYIFSINEIPKLLLQFRRKTMGSTDFSDRRIRAVAGKEITKQQIEQKSQSLEPVKDVHMDSVSSIQDSKDFPTIPEVQLFQSGKTLNVISSEMDTVATHAVDAKLVTPVEKIETISCKVKCNYVYPPEDCKHIGQDMIVDISGEYQCESCGMMRMFCKGDLVGRCENQDCIPAISRYSLQHDLF